MERLKTGSEQPDEIETLWAILETVLLTGKEQVASSTFRLLIAYAQLDILRQKTAFLPTPNLPMTQAKESSLEKLWSSVLMAYRCGHMQACKSCFVRSIAIHCRFAELAGYPRILFTSTSRSS